MEVNEVNLSLHYGGMVRYVLCMSLRDWNMRAVNKKWRAHNPEYICWPVDVSFLHLFETLSCFMTVLTLKVLHSFHSPSHKVWLLPVNFTGLNLCLKVL